MTDAGEKTAWAEAERRATFLADLLERSADPEASRQAGRALVDALAAYRAAIAPKRPSKKES